MKSSSSLRIVFLAAIVSVLAVPAFAGPQLGVGVHYLRTLSDIEDDSAFDKNSLGFIGSVAFTGSVVRLEFDLEAIPDYVGSDEIMWQPQAYALLGDFIYGGIGAGIGHLGEFGWQDPFLALRAGVNFKLGQLDLDTFASYRFQKASDLETLSEDSLDSITFGAMLRFGGE